MELLVGTRHGLFRIGDGEPEPVAPLAGSELTWLSCDGATCWAIVDGTVLWRGIGASWDRVHILTDDLVGRCVLPTSAGVFVGTSGAHLLRVDAETGAVDRLEGFDHIEGRDRWSNPDGSPPDTRSLSEDPAGRLYANVHVGGIVTSEDGGVTWDPTSIDVSADVHQVLALGDGSVLAATGRTGLCSSRDHGQTWTTAVEGLPLAHQEFGMENDRYCRAVAVSADTVLITASTGAFTDRAGIFRRGLSSDAPFEKCTAGLPEWFADNINTGCLDATDQLAVFGTNTGHIHVSSDHGETWYVGADGLPPVLGLAILDAAP